MAAVTAPSDRYPHLPLSLLAPVLGLCLGHCASRTLPLPPPAIDQVSPSVEGTVTVRGLALSTATVAVLNEDSGEGVLVTPADDGVCEDRCEFSTEVRALPGATLRIWQFFDTESATFHTVEEP